MDDRGVILVVDLGNGDQDKGATLDALARQYDVHTVVRYNGGPQAAHNVVTVKREQHTFSQFGSATLVPGVRTHLSRFMIIHPRAMNNEEAHLRALGMTDAFLRTSIDELCLVITPFQQAMNRLRELARGDGRHGSCGMGVGETKSDFIAHGYDVLVAGDLSDKKRTRRKLEFLREVKLEQLRDIHMELPQTDQVRAELSAFDSKIVNQYVEVFFDFAKRTAIVDGEYLGDSLSRPGIVVFEGAQGALLDEAFGFPPYHTWSNTLLNNAYTLLEEADYNDQVVSLGLLRSYATRHGPGPLVTEEAALSEFLLEPHNVKHDWQREFRVGYLDPLALRYSLEVVGGVDFLGIGHIDMLPKIPQWNVCVGYQSDSIFDEDVFDMQGGMAIAIKVHRPADLVHQAKLTHALMACTPQYETINKNTGETGYLGRIEQKLGTPISLIGRGPTAADREFIRPLLRQ